LAEADYWRFVIHHYLDRFQNWEALPIQAGSTPSAVAAQVGDLSLFALTAGLPFSQECLPQKRKGTGLQENGSPVSGTGFVYS